MHLAENGAADIFEESVENPLTNVINPEPKRLRVLEIEAELQNGGHIPKDERLSKMETAADLYEDLGDDEKALAVLKRVLKARNGKDGALLNKMGILCGSMGDHKRQEKFYRESARVSSLSAPLFNLALAQRERGEARKAIETLEQAIKHNKDAAYLVLRAGLANDAEDGKTADRCLKEAFKSFGPMSELSDWELSWYTYAAKMAKDKKKFKKAGKERKRRLSAQSGIDADASVLPAIKASGLKRSI
jgi:tetratricopeptide (TPR) repeat protein